MVAFDIMPGLRFAPRDSWGANPAHPRLGVKVPRSKRTHVFVHHTVMVDADTTPNIWESEAEIFSMMRKIQTCRPDLGLDVPYNFVAFMSATNDGLYVCEGRGEDRAGAHTKGHNTHAIAVSFAGDFEKGSIGSMEIARRMPLLSYFLGWLRYNPSHEAYGSFGPMSRLGTFHPADRRVWFHRDVTNTACPGGKLEMHLRQVDFIKPEDG